LNITLVFARKNEFKAQAIGMSQIPPRKDNGITPTMPQYWVSRINVIEMLE
jgi:hypothetical protein